MPVPIPITSELFIALWLRTVKGSTEDQAKQVYHQLDQHYNKPQRYYHNWSHVGQCLGFIEEMATQLDVADEVRLAIWFHDVICTPGQSDNERHSVDFFRHCIGDPDSRSVLCDRIESLIMATCHCSDLTTIDLAAMADADLGSFCLPWDQFHRDSLQVLEEYGNSTEKKAGKVAFLQNLLERPSIYHSAHFLQHYENRARCNIQRELALMQS